MRRPRGGVAGLAETLETTAQIRNDLASTVPCLDVVGTAGTLRHVEGLPSPHPRERERGPEDSPPDRGGVASLTDSLRRVTRDNPPSRMRMFGRGWAASVNPGPAPGNPKRRRALARHGPIKPSPRVPALDPRRARARYSSDVDQHLLAVLPRKRAGSGPAARGHRGTRGAAPRWRGARACRHVPGLGGEPACGPSPGGGDHAALRSEPTRDGLSRQERRSRLGPARTEVGPRRLRGARVDIEPSAAPASRRRRRVARVM